MSVATGPEAISQYRNDIMPLLRGGVDARNAGDAKLAEALLTAARAFNPDHWQSHYELGILHENADRRDDAIGSFRDALRRNSRSASAAERLSAHLAVSGRTREAHEVLASATPEEDAAKERINAASAFVRYVEQYPIEIARDIWADEVEARGGMLPLPAVTDRILSAISQKTPFAMVRLGDGEGTWLHHHVDERRFGALYEINRKIFWDIWFGEHAAEHMQSFFGVTEQISRDLSGADIIGIPPITWIEHEYKYASLRGYPGTLNALRVAASSSPSTTAFTTQLIHFEMAQENSLHTLISAAKRVSVVTCHPQMGEFLSSTFGIFRPEVILIPGEPSRRHIHGDDVTTGTHYPDRYMELMRQIESCDYSGHLCLVAGGLLGKSYALAMKRAGGVAVDIGSIADKMLGKNTRPGC